MMFLTHDHDEGERWVEQARAYLLSVGVPMMDAAALQTVFGCGCTMRVSTGETCSKHAPMLGIPPECRLCTAAALERYKKEQQR